MNTVDLFHLAEQARKERDGVPVDDSSSSKNETDDPYACDDCGCHALLSDTIEATLVCTECGCVKSDPFVRAEDEDFVYDTMQRCGYPVDVAMGDHATTHVERTTCKTYQQKRLFTMSRWGSVPSKFRQHWTDLKTAEDCAIELTPLAQSLLQKITKEQFFRDRTRKAIIGACYLYGLNGAKNGSSTPVSSSTVAEKLGIPTPMLKRAEEKLEQFLREEKHTRTGTNEEDIAAFATPSSNGGDFVLSLCRKLPSLRTDRALFFRVKRGADAWIERTKHDPKLGQHKAIANACAAVSLSMVEQGLVLSKEKEYFPIVYAQVRKIMGEMKAIAGPSDGASSSHAL